MPVSTTSFLCRWYIGMTMLAGGMIVLYGINKPIFPYVGGVRYCIIWFLSPIFSA